MDVPEALKPISPFLARAAELDDEEPLLSYYCRLYSVKHGMKLVNSENKEFAQGYLLQLMDKLEEMKKAFNELGTPVPDDKIGSQYASAFALKVFLQADNEDRAGKASRKTAKNFLAASNFFELLKLFGEVPGDIQEKQKYAKWKAADILKAFKEGRTPVPGPPGGDPNLKPQEHFNQPPPQNQPPPSHFQQPPQQPQRPQQPPQQPPSSSSINQSKPFNYANTQPQNAYNLNRKTQDDDDDDEYQPSYDPLMIAEVQKMCKYAISALNYEDVVTAMSNLEKALFTLKTAKKS